MKQFLEKTGNMFNWKPSGNRKLYSRSSRAGENRQKLTFKRGSWQERAATGLALHTERRLDLAPLLRSQTTESRAAETCQKSEGAGRLGVALQGTVPRVRAEV